MDIDLKGKFKSHRDKLLYDHLIGVLCKAQKRCNLKIVEYVSIFHDLGKINNNFQNKLEGKKTGYDSHSYLSSLAWILFFNNNSLLVRERIGDNQEDILAIATIIAKHHGDLPDMDKGFFSEDPRESLKKYLSTLLYLPISEFLQLLYPHQNFVMNISETEAIQFIDGSQSLFYSIVKKNIKNPLRFFQDTQYAFACLIESDKRDAGNNSDYERDVIGEKLRQIYETKLVKRFNEYSSNNKLNCLRTEIRCGAVENLKIKLENGERVFTLTSPTGSGKTMMLFALAQEIIKSNHNHDIIYVLPFLSITEQVEEIAKDVFGDEYVLRVDSKSQNKEIQYLLEMCDNEPEKIQELLSRVFSEETFDHPFIITTFVKYFETLVSNRNSELLKLPNFSKRIFLIDEIQALPPRLYIFFVALIDEFCNRNDSYAIFSTATMPYMEINESTKNGMAARALFKNYPKYNEAKNRELLNSVLYFSNEVFNRYVIRYIDDNNFTIDDLAEKIILEEKSCLVILNTIQDTKKLYSRFDCQSDVYVLLNTHFHLEDRKEKIKYCKKRIAKGERVVLISTQLIEAGVDIDFPVLFRDFCPLPSLIQSAGRCNRNGGKEKGRVYFFELKGSDNTISSRKIYKGEVGDIFLEFCKKNIVGEVCESELFKIQERFFKEVVGGLCIGWHYQKGLKNNAEKIDMIECIANSGFDTLGQFKLINEKEYGEEYRYYIPKGGDDGAFETLIEIYKRLSVNQSYDEVKKVKIDLTYHMRLMSEREVVIRLHESQKNMLPQSTEEVLGVRKLVQENGYSFEKGISINGLNNFFI